jgi:multiple sugar transport system ATP-binding protein
MANLKLKSLNKIYPSGALALYNVNLELSDKEFIAVVGGEKSGKSTLLRVIAGLEEVSEGEIYIDGKEVSNVEPKDRDIAMIFQNNTLYPALNVFDNMAFGLKLRKAPQAVIEQRVKAAADILGVSDILYRKPKALTTEQKQKVALGRAIVREPKLYLFDDPIAGLGAELKAQMRNVIINLQARMEGTFIYATKNVNEALTMATRVIVLREGMVQQIDTPANLYDYPANAYVAFLIGSPSINFINGASLQRAESGEVTAVFNGGQVTLPKNIVDRFADIEEYISANKKLILGLRGEDLKVVEGSDYNFACKVSATEEVSGKAFAECDLTPSISFVLQADGVKSGDEVKISADLTRLYIFDADTRFNLLSRDEGYVKTSYAEADVKPLSYLEEEEIKKKMSAPVTSKKKK